MFITRRIVCLLSLLLAACTTTPPAQSFTPKFDQVAIECRALLVSDEFVKSVVRPHSPTKFEIEHLDNSEVNLWIRASQADARTITLDFPRLTLWIGATGTLPLHEQSFVNNPPSANRDPPWKTDLEDLNLTLDLTVAETPEHQFLVTLKQVRAANSSVPGRWRFVVPPGLPLQVVTADRAVFALVGMHDEASPIQGHRELILMIRCQGIIQKEIENELFGPGYDKPTGGPNPRVR